MKYFSKFILLAFTLTAWASLSAQTQSDEVRYNQYGVPVDRIPLLSERRGGILVFESADQQQKIWFDTRIQVDGAAFLGDTYNPIGNGVALRRARFAMKTILSKKWYGEIDLDFANSELEIKDAYLMYLPKDNLGIKVGNFKEGFSIEATTTSRYLTFLERPMAVNAFAPSRHIGMAATYNYKWLYMVGGIHFQDVGGLEERTNSLNNNKDLGVDEGHSFTGKIVFMPLWSKRDGGIHLGAAASYRTPTTEVATPGSVRYSTRSLTSINRKKYLDTDEITNVDYTLLNGFEFAAYYKNFRLQGEYIKSDVHRLNDQPTEKFQGFYVMGSCMLFGGNYRYNKAEAEFTQPGRGRTWGDIELALRYDMIDLNSRMDGIMGGAGEGYTAGVNFYANDAVKIMLNYSYVNHDRYANGKGKLFTGYDTNGILTANPANIVNEKGKAGEDFSIVSVRFEIDF
jgi:phosphate-selective porin OprO/OprP